MSFLDKLPPKGMGEAYRQRRSNCVGVWGIKIQAVISLALTFGLMAGALRVSLWETSGPSAVVESA